jgi:hypothetical protein
VRSDVAIAALALLAAAFVLTAPVLGRAGHPQAADVAMAAAAICGASSFALAAAATLRAARRDRGAAREQREEERA